jgi:hypothetical protein
MANFSSQNPGTWFYYNGEEAQGGVCLRELSTEEHDRIERLTVKKKKKVIRGVPVDDVKEDKELASKLRWDFCIVDWNRTSLDGQELECTKENKVKMMKVIDFVKFVVDSLNELIDVNKSLEEAQGKNLPPSSNGNTKSPTAANV